MLFTNVRNKLECLSLASLSNRMARAYMSEKHLSCVSLYGRFLALFTNIRLGRKVLTGSNTLAYYKH
jgi:hypothetical protein